MSMQDPIANMLTIIRNAIKSKKRYVVVPYSKFLEKIIKKILQEKYIKSYKIIKKKDSNLSLLKITLAYIENQSVITNLKRISKPGVRIYAKYDEMPRVLNNLGLAIISTSKGILTDKEARTRKIGGEVIAYVW